MSKATEKLIERNEAMKALRALGVKPGAKIYTNVNHVARSGMSRHISLYVVHKGQLVSITWRVGKILGYAEARHGRGLVVGGCGMDMCFATVYALGRAMWPKGGKAHMGRNSDVKVGGHEPDGGYLLRYESM